MPPEAPSLVSPKQPSLAKDRDWYPYYAGFTEEFAEAVMSDHLADAASVLDPWSGSGTTTVVAARSGRSSVGIDVNPALTVIARARVVPQADGVAILDHVQQILDVAQTLDIQPQIGDPLSRWMRANAVGRVRAVQRAIHMVAEAAPPCLESGGQLGGVDSFSPRLCLLYAALFAAVRELLERFGTTNPMWLKDPPTYRNKLATSQEALEALYLKAFQFLQDRLTIDSDSHGPALARFQTGSANSLALPDCHFDGVLTSPPYATRIDYVMGTLPELAVLGADGKFLAALRQATTGTPVVSGRPAGQSSDEIVSRYGRDLREAIEHHPSKGSKPYYVPWIHNYMLGLQKGLSEAVRTVRPGGRICVVVQDSYYKSLHIDTQRIVGETLASLGKAFVARDDFPVNTVFSRVNPKAVRHLKARNNVESLLVFE